MFVKYKMNSNILVMIIVASLVIGLITFVTLQSRKSHKGKRYACVNNFCVEDENGPYLTSDCNNDCKPVPGPTPDPEPIPSLSTFEEMALTASPGTGVLDMFPYINSSNDEIDWYKGGNKSWPDDKKYDNYSYESSMYKKLMLSDFESTEILPCDTIERSKLLSYIMGVFYATDINNLQRLTTDELTAFYRCLVFFFITTQETQPDGGWYGSYWKKRILDQGPDHNKNTGETPMTAVRNESFFFDQNMTTQLPTYCPSYQKYKGKCPPHSKYFGNRIFAEMCQSTLRRGMRNSPQVLAENPPWSEGGNIINRFGTGGFPANSYLECLQFPQEHGKHGWPSGCDASTANCELKEGYPDARYQPNGKDRSAGGDPYCGLKPVWFYFAQGLGQFWNLGQTAYCYNYVDIFLNAPMGIGPNVKNNGERNPIGWSNGFGGCSETLGFSGTLGYDIEDPSMPTEHDYNYPAYSMKLLLEFASRVDIPGGCRGQDCNAALRDPRTGMTGLAFCGAQNGVCSCEGKVDAERVDCLNQRGPGMGEDITASIGCGPTQPINSRSDSFNEQVAALMGIKKGTYWKPYAMDGTSTYYLNSAKGVDGTLNDYGGYDPTPAWAAARNKKNPIYPVRSDSDKTYLTDKRSMICGWVNGHFYGFPKGDKIDSYTPNPFKGGMPGIHPVTGKIIYGKPNTEEDPTIYYDMKGNELYRTWKGKQLKMDEHTALLMMAEFYSCGDTGFENKNANWPFGCYFGYGQALGGPGKAATTSISCVPYSCTTVQFTSTATAYGSLVQPAYDFEILYTPPVDSSSYETNCVCATAVTLDLTADFDSDTPGEDLKRYLCLNKGSTGGYVPVDSPAGRTAVAFQGQNMKVTNWTTVGDDGNTFDPYTANEYGVDSNPQPLEVCNQFSK